MTDCTCPKCVECCERRPGWFKPGEAEKAAELFRMSLRDFFEEYLVVDFWVADIDINLLMPRQTTKEGGGRLSYSDGFTSSPCVFLSNDDRCMIHSAKPHECKQAMGCSENESTNWHEAVAMTWDNPESQQRIEDLLSGEEP